jgi:hypothetical protein
MQSNKGMQGYSSQSNTFKNIDLKLQKHSQKNATLTQRCGILRLGRGFHNQEGG